MKKQTNHFNIWQETAQKELKHKPLESLTKTSLEGIAIQPIYFNPADPNTQNEPLAGEFPYTRGVKATMYAGRPWTIRQYAGFSTAEDSNAFYKKALKAGQKGLSVAFDLATHRGYDSDHPRVLGDVGKAGVAIDSVEDMKILFADIPLDDVSVSMTMNGAVLPILASFIVAAEEQGVSQDKLSGTIQNDILKEFMVRNTYIYPPEPSMKIIADIIEYTAQKMPKFNSISISGYHLQEAGANLVQELAFTLADGLEYVKLAQKNGLDIDSFAPRLSFFFAIGMNFFMEIAKLRAARKLWAEIMQKQGAVKPESLMLRTHCQTSGVSLTEKDPYNNVMRTAFEAMAAVLGGTQSLHTNSFDEAIALPTEFSARIARNTQLILQHETGITDVVDPLGGSYYIESLTDQMCQEVQKIFDHIEQLGGMQRAIEQGYPQRLVEESATKRQARFENKQDLVVGVNCYPLENEPAVDILDIDTDKVRGGQVERLMQIRHSRDNEKVEQLLDILTECAKTGQGNLLAKTIDCMRARASLGEVSYALEKVFKRHHAYHTVQTGVYSAAMPETSLADIRKKTAEFRANSGRSPRILIAKMGQDGHDRGAKVMATGLSDVGFEVILSPLFCTAVEIATQAIEEDVHFIGISSQAAGHKTLIPQLYNELKTAGADHILMVCGGIIPVQDYDFLKQNGVKAIFPPGTTIIFAAEKMMGFL